VVEYGSGHGSYSCCCRTSIRFQHPSKLLSFAQSTCLVLNQYSQQQTIFPQVLGTSCKSCHEEKSINTVSCSMIADITCHLMARYVNEPFGYSNSLSLTSIRFTNTLISASAALPQSEPNNFILPFIYLNQQTLCTTNCFTTTSAAVGPPTPSPNAPSIATSSKGAAS